ncbi:hypothetical protein BDR03DRAFT_997729 [Suillus americanus]|nr:hypothetical protein BDR03DRAFT_997729 [Suillus americanus]
MSTSFADHLLASVSPITIHPVCRTKDKMDIFMKMPARRARRLQTQTELQMDTDVEGDSILETEGGLGQQAFVEAERKRAKPAGETKEKNWEHLFRAIYSGYHMRKLLMQQMQEHNADGSQRLCKLPFAEMADLRYWSSEFATNPVLDAHAMDSGEPNLVLLDYRLRKVTGIARVSLWRRIAAKREGKNKRIIERTTTTLCNH